MPENHFVRAYPRDKFPMASRVRRPPTPRPRAALMLRAPVGIDLGGCRLSAVTARCRESKILAGSSMSWSRPWASTDRTQSCRSAFRPRGAGWRRSYGINPAVGSGVRCGRRGRERSSETVSRGSTVTERRTTPAAVFTDTSCSPGHDRWKRATFHRLLPSTKTGR
jgi:hypothetical protein